MRSAWCISIQLPFTGHRFPVAHSLMPDNQFWHQPLAVAAPLYGLYQSPKGPVYRRPESGIGNRSGDRSHQSPGHSASRTAPKSIKKQLATHWSGACQLFIFGPKSWFWGKIAWAYCEYPPSCIWAYCESRPKWEIRIFLFKFLEVSENQIWHRKLACVVSGWALLAAFQAASWSRDFEPIPALANVHENVLKWTNDLKTNT